MIVAGTVISCAVDVVLFDSTSAVPLPPDVVTVKLVEDVAVWPLTVTLILPVVAPPGTVVVIVVAVLFVIVAVTPLNFTVLFADVVLKLVPVIVTVVPVVPLVGLKLETVGAEPTGGGPLPCFVMFRAYVPEQVPLASVHDQLPAPSMAVPELAVKSIDHE